MVLENIYYNELVDMIPPNLYLTEKTSEEEEELNMYVFMIRPNPSTIEVQNDVRMCDNVNHVLF